MLERRTMLAGLAALPAAGLLTLSFGAITAEVTYTEGPATPLAFDPAAFIADLKAAGYSPIAYRAVPRGGEPAEPPGYFIRPPKGRGFGAAYTAVMARWWDAMDACPDHAERVATHILGPIGRTA